MSNAWETTDEDIINVINDMDKKASEDKVHEILNNLNQFNIEDAALNGDDIDEQTKYAYKEIKKQIIEKNLI